MSHRSVQLEQGELCARGERATALGLRPRLGFRLRVGCDQLVDAGAEVAGHLTVLDQVSQRPSRDTNTDTEPNDRKPCRVAGLEHRGRS